ncbi:MAG: hypothetical protein K9L17_02200 [Clostridiales bacterium]|nr:hypothetical protein [Clostridiales bacterium]MCF8021496.1 hypothetical protein [Clostridiales bacterium]
MNLKQWILKNLEKPFYQMELVRAEVWCENKNKRDLRLNKVNRKRPAHHRF